jgi:hypothetical protein
MQQSVSLDNKLQHTSVKDAPNGTVEMLEISMQNTKKEMEI